MLHTRSVCSGTHIGMGANPWAGLPPKRVPTCYPKIEEYGMKISVEKSKAVVMTRNKRDGRGIIEINGKH